MAQNNMHNLTTLIKRLEAATSRLEDIASSTFEKPSALDAAPGAQTAAAAQAAVRASAPPAAPGAAPAPEKESSPMLEAFNALLDNELKQFVELSKQLAEPIAEQASALSEAFTAQHQLLQVSTLAKKPDMSSPVFLEVLKDLQTAIEKVDQVKQISRDAELKNHLTMVSDGVGILGLVIMDSKPGDVAAELFGGAQMAGNKVLKEYKDKDRTQVEWVQCFYRLFKTLILYIKNNHPKGVQWNPQGIDASEALRQVKSGGTNGAPAAPAPPAGGAPPPPPPPPLPTFDNIPPPPGPAPAGKRGGVADMGAVFDELNKGESVTAGLKKVDASQMTHKNPTLRASSTVPERKDSTGSRGKSPAPPAKKSKPESMRTKKPPKLELDGNKWIVENFEDQAEPVVIEATLVQSILITKCSKTTIQVKGKANAISIDNSSRASIVLDSLVSSIDVIKCPNFALQVLGTVPTVLIDQVDGAAIYLGKDSLSTEIISSKSSSININLPPLDDQEDYTEHPLPEQFKTYIKDGKVVSEIVEHAG